MSGETDAFLRRVAHVADVAPPPPSLAAGTMVDGTYRIERKLGAGGMGVVYLAHDVRLDRDVALKLHTGSLGTAGTERLRREAMAMARLVHAHVVTVHEVGTHDGHAFVAMEYVAGGTARSWLAARPRSRRDILELYLRAGRGLAAAHAAGLVHRDFKPDNVLVGDDWRVRVADFGLARALGEAASPGFGAAAAGADGPGASPDLTATGAVLGTPAYMAPEQRDARSDVGPAADQFAFCVALWEALYGVRPADGVAVGGHGGPRHVRAALQRGLAPAPGDRFPSMDALLAELARDPWRALRHAAIAAAAVAALGGIAFAVTREPGAAGTARPDPCATAEARVVAVWGADRRAALGRSFAASGRPGSAETARRTSAAIDRTLASWSSERRRVCRAPPPPALAAGRETPLACFDRRLDELDAALAVLADADAGAVDGAVDIVLSRPPAAECADPVRAARWPAPPPAAAAAVAAARALIEEGTIRVRTRQTERALALAIRAQRAAAATGWAPLQAEARLLTALTAESATTTVAELEATYTAAVAAGHPNVAAFAAIYATHLLASAPDQAEAAQAWATRAVALAERDLAGSHHEVMALIAAALIHEAAGRYRDALPLAERAVAAAERLPGEHAPFLLRAEDMLGAQLDYLGQFDDARAHIERALELAEELHGGDAAPVIPMVTNLAIVMRELGRTTDALMLHERALKLAVTHRGAQHPSVADIRVNVGLVRQARHEPAQAIAQFEEALRIVRETRGADAPQVALILGNISAAYGERGDLARALATAQESLALYRRLRGPDHPDTAMSQVSVAIALIAHGRHREALPLLRAAIAVLDAAMPGNPEVLPAHTALARVHDALGRHDDAVAELTSALAIRRARVESPFDLGGTLTLLGQALWNRHRGDDRARAVTLVTEARNLYARPGAAAEDLRADADHWLATRADPAGAAAVSFFE